jgi:chromosome segregation ATPase
MLIGFTDFLSEKIARDSSSFDSCSQLSDRIQEVAAKMEQLQQHYQEQIANLHDRNAELAERVRCDEGEIGNYRGTNADLRAQIEELGREIANLHDQNAELAERVRCDKGEIGNYRGTNADLRAQIEKLGMEIASLRDQNGSLIAESEAKSGRIEELASRLNHLSHDYASVRSSCNELASSHVSLEREMVMEEFETQRAQATIGALTTQRDRFGEENEGLRGRVSELQTAIDSLERAMEELRGEAEFEIDRLSEENAELQQQIADLQAQTEEQEGEIANLRRQVVQQNGETNGFREFARKAGNYVSDRDDTIEELRNEVARLATESKRRK